MESQEKKWVEQPENFDLWVGGDSTPPCIRSFRIVAGTMTVQLPTAPPATVRKAWGAAKRNESLA